MNTSCVTYIIFVLIFLFFFSLVYLLGKICITIYTVGHAKPGI